MPRQEVDIVRVDNEDLDGAIPTISHPHHETHEGNHFYYTEFNTIASAGTRELLLTTPDTNKLLNFRFTVSGTLITTVRLFEGTSKTGGTAVTILNNYRDHANVSGATLTHTPAGSGDGTAIFVTSFGSASNPANAVGGATSQDDEIILKRNTKYLLRVTSGSNSNVVRTKLFWYEHTYGDG